MMWGIMILDLTSFFLVTLIIVFYYFGTCTYGLWKKLGVPYKKPKFPVLGNFYQAVFSFRPTCEVHQEFYKGFGCNRFGGLFSFRTPVLMIKDPSLIEAILVKDFTSFYNRGTGADTELDPLASHLLNLEGIKWRRLRQKLSPTFTSGKLKGMQPLLVDCADQLIRNCYKLIDEGRPLKCRDMMGKFSTDVIGCCAFGLDIKSMENPQSKFRAMVKLSARSSWTLKLRTAIRGKLPGLLKLLRWKNQPQVVQNFFFSFVSEAISYREKNNFYRNDFLQLMMEIRKQDLKNLSKVEDDNDEKSLVLDEQQMTASSYQFLAAGFATTSLTLTFCLYELSVNQDVQQKVYEEIVKAIAKYEGEFTYQAVKDMKYLGQVLSETLRKHPPAPALIRKATIPYQIPGTEIVLPKGMDIIIPTYSIHHDPQYYPQPEKFLPERFGVDNEDEIRKYTYLPFGDGPRTCIASRFAKMEIMTGLSKLIYMFRVTLNSKTKTPLIYKKSGTFVEPVDDVWLDLHPRLDKNRDITSL